MECVIDNDVIVDKNFTGDLQYEVFRWNKKPAITLVTSVLWQILRLLNEFLLNISVRPWT